MEVLVVKGVGGLSFSWTFLGRRGVVAVLSCLPEAVFQ